MTIGFRVLARARTVGADIVRDFAKLPVANVSDVMSRMTAGGPRLRPMHAGGQLAGPALTVKTRPGDNLLVHKALQMAKAGDVLVVDAGGDLTNAIIGELMLAHAEVVGLAGIVIDGAIRDSAAIRASRLPVYAAGVTHRGPYKDGPGEVNVSVAIDGMVIQPGDLVLGDEDGLVCVPFDDVDTVYRAAKAKHEAEEAMMAETRKGNVTKPWVDQRLKELGWTGI